MCVCLFIYIYFYLDTAMSWGLEDYFPQSHDWFLGFVI